MGKKWEQQLLPSAPCTSQALHGQQNRMYTQLTNYVHSRGDEKGKSFPNEALFSILIVSKSDLFKWKTAAVRKILFCPERLTVPPHADTSGISPGFSNQSPKILHLPKSKQ